TLKPPSYLPDDVDGRVLFNVATTTYKAAQEGKKPNVRNYDLASIVMVPPVKEARGRGVLKSKGRFTELTRNSVIWEDGTKEEIDVVIWCTGFLYATNHLSGLVEIHSGGPINTAQTKAEN